MKYFFIPGRAWAISSAELKSVLSVRNIPHVELSGNEQVLLYDLQLDVEESNEFFHSLGGFIKYGMVIDDPYEYLHEKYVGARRQKNGRINFAVSFYSPKESKKKILDEKQKLGMGIKKWFKGNDFRSRFVSKRDDTETSLVLLNTNKVFDTGFELNRMIHPGSKSAMWGITFGVQDYENFAKRDYSRPRANKKKGMIPPKLARMMVNLASVPSGSVIWDPFCGSGTILMEALSLGHTVVGTDVDPGSISESKENAHWLCDAYWISHQQYSIFEHDIKDGVPEGVNFDAIVTEPFLGPVLRKEVTVDRIESIIGQIEPLFRSLEEIAQVISEGSKSREKRMVIVVPGFKSPQGWIDMDSSFSGSESFKEIQKEITAHPLQWERPNSIIRRNIKVFAF